MIKSFDELKKFIDEANAAVLRCEKGKEKYQTNQIAVLSHIAEANRLIVEATKNYKIESGDDANTKKGKVTEILARLQKSREEQLKMGKYISAMKTYTDDVLADSIHKAAEKVFGYRQFRTVVKNKILGTKMEIAGSATQLKKFLIKNDSDKDVLKNIDIFLQKLQAANFYEMNQKIKKGIIDAFEEATHVYVALTENRTARKGVYTTYVDALNEMLESATEYSEKSVACWGLCHRLRDELENNKYVNKVRAELDVVNFEESLKTSMGDLARREEQVKKIIVENMPLGEGAAAIKKVAATKIPKEIDWLKAAYSLGTWVYENYGEEIGEEIGLPKEAKFSIGPDLPSIDAEVGIPLYHCGIASLELEFGVSVEPSIGIEGALTLHNFFSASEDTFVSGTIAAKAGIEASAFVGLALVLVEIIKASGRIVLSAKAEIGMEGSVKLTKSNIEGYPALECKSSAGLEIVLAGHLEAVLGLTAALKVLIKAVTGKKAELKFKTDTLNFFKVGRTAEITFELPVHKKPTSFPKDQLNLSSGEWEVEFIAQEQLKQFFKEKFGGMNKWNEIKSQTPLTNQEIEELKTLYSSFGIRATNEK